MRCSKTLGPEGKGYEKLRGLGITKHFGYSVFMNS